MIDFNTLIFELAAKQEPYHFPIKTMQTRNRQKESDEDQFNSLIIELAGDPTEFSLVRSGNLISAMVHILIFCPLLNMAQLESDFQNYLYQWLTINQSILDNYHLQHQKLINHLDNQVDHENLLTLFSLIFNVNIIVLNLDRQFRLYSCQDHRNLHILLFQHSDLTYSAIKFHSKKYDSISSVLGFSVIEYNHPVIQHCVDLLISSEEDGVVSA